MVQCDENVNAVAQTQDKKLQQSHRIMEWRISVLGKCCFPGMYVNSTPKKHPLSCCCHWDWNNQKSTAPRYL